MKRNLLENRLLVLEQTIEQERQHGAAAPELVECVESLLSRLGLVNAKLAEMRGPGAPT